MRALSILIKVVLNFRSNNSNISVISESSSYAYLSLRTLFSLSTNCHFLLKAGHGILVKKDYNK